MLGAIRPDCLNIVMTKTVSSLLRENVKVQARDTCDRDPIHLTVGRSGSAIGEGDVQVGICAGERLTCGCSADPVAITPE